MVQVPISPTIMKAYRDTLLIPSSPSFLDTDLPIQPVAIIATAASESSAQFTKLTDGTDNLAIRTGGNIDVAFQTGDSTQTIVSATCGKAGSLVTSGTGLNLRSVTAGKTFYCTGFNFSPGAALGFEIRDGNIAGTLKFAAVVTNAQPNHFVFQTPIVFTTATFVDTNNTQTNTWSLSGWEE